MGAAVTRKGLVILDRDGVINQDSAEFVKSPAEWLPLPGSIEAIAALSRAGYAIAVASNQSGLARGLFDQAALDAMHDKFRGLVEAEGGRVDHIAICPHGPDAGCDCRKPNTGLYRQIAAQLDMNVADAPSIGDSFRDLQAAAAAGAQPMLVRTGNGQKAEAELTGRLTYVPVFDDLAEAALYILSDS